MQSARTADRRDRDVIYRELRSSRIQRFRTQVDAAARQVFLAARAYDFDTGRLADSHQRERFLLSILRERQLGIMEGGIPLAGGGLAGILADLMHSYEVSRQRYGISAPSIQRTGHSIRSEYFRLPPNETGDAGWRQALKDARVEDLSSHPAFAQCCAAAMRATGDEPQPGIVLSFGTRIEDGINLFGHRRSGADPSYPTDVFATRLRATAILAAELPPTIVDFSAYLVPIGDDLTRHPHDLAKTRRWPLVPPEYVPTPGTSPVAAAGDQPAAVGANRAGARKMRSRQRSQKVFAFDPQLEARYQPALEDEWDTQAIGRSLANTHWVLVIPGSSIDADPARGLELLIGSEDAPGIRDIRLHFWSFAYAYRR